MYTTWRKFLKNKKNKNNLDFLWWNIHLLDKVPEREALVILKDIDNLLNEHKNKNLLYWFLRFLKDNNPFILSSKVKAEIKKLIKIYILKIRKMCNSQKIPFEKYMIREPLNIINKYWGDNESTVYNSRTS